MEEWRQFQACCLADEVAHTDYVPHVDSQGRPKRSRVDESYAQELLAAAKALKGRGDASWAAQRASESLDLWLMAALRFYQAAEALAEAQQLVKARNVLSQTGAFLEGCCSKGHVHRPRRVLATYCAALCYGRAFYMCRKETRSLHLRALTKYRLDVDPKSVDPQRVADMDLRVEPKHMVRMLESQGDLYKCMDAADRAQQLLAHDEASRAVLPPFAVDRTRQPFLAVLMYAIKAATAMEARNK